MALLPSREALWEKGKVGDWAIVDATDTQPTYIFLRIPGREFDDWDESRGQTCMLPLGPQDTHPRPMWQWDGNREAPTLNPSILHHSNPPWHGYLRAGQLVTA
jgi:hypothetical protein